MRRLICSLATPILAAGLIAAAPIKPAKADGGTTVAVIAGYLAVDYVVGRKCGYRYWPFNMVHKLKRTKRCRAYDRRRYRKR